MSASDISQYDPTRIFGITTAATAMVTTLSCLPTATTGSTETSAEEEATAYRTLRRKRLVATAGDNLALDAARGGGEYLQAMAYLTGCPIEVHRAFAAVAQRNFDQVFPQPDLDPGTILQNLKAQVSQDPLLVAECSDIS